MSNKTILKRILNISFFTLVLILIGFITYAQNLPVACGGSIERYRVEGDNGNSDFQWIITGGSVVTTYNRGDSVDIQWGSLAGIRTLTVIETNAFGCEGMPWSQTLMVSSPSVNLGLDEEICSGETYEFIASASNITSYLWQDNVTTTETFIASTSGIYWVRVTNADGCSATDSANLVVHNLPAVDLGPDTTICEADGSIVFDVSQYGISYNWLDNESIFPTYTAYVQTYDQEIWVNVTNEYGCVGSDTVVVRFCGEIKIPNAFTPNDDGFNDTWKIDNLFSFPNVSVDVYNRWGDRVFSSKGYTEEFKGFDKKGKKLPMDAYYYVIDLGNGEEAIVGTVTIIR